MPRKKSKLTVSFRREIGLSAPCFFLSCLPDIDKIKNLPRSLLFPPPTISPPPHFCSTQTTSSVASSPATLTLAHTKNVSRPRHCTVVAGPGPVRRHWRARRRCWPAIPFANRRRWHDEWDEDVRRPPVRMPIDEAVLAGCDDGESALSPLASVRCLPAGVTATSFLYRRQANVWY